MSTTPDAVTQPAAPILDMMGRPIRRINPQRMLKTGDHIMNVHGQGLWELLAFHPSGVRVGKWPEGAVSDWPWSRVYEFYERVPADDLTLAEVAESQRALERAASPHQQL